MTHIDLCSPLQLFGDWVSNQFLLSITEFFYQETLYYFFPVPQTCPWWQPQSIGKSENSSQIVAASANVYVSYEPPPLHALWSIATTGSQNGAAYNTFAKRRQHEHWFQSIQSKLFGFCRFMAATFELTTTYPP